MAGKNHHHVWKHIQNGFGEKRGKDHHIWVYSKEGGAKRTSTRKYGAEKYFYGPEDSAADANITKFENTVQELVTQARGAVDGTTLASAQIAPLISHLEMRSLFLRNSISDLSEKAARFVANTFASAKSTKLMLESYLRNHPEKLDEEISKLGLTDSDQNLAREIAATLIPRIIEEKSSEISSQISELFEPLLSQATEAAISAHIKSLESDFDEIERTESHLAMTYYVRKFDGEPLLLPDTGLAFISPKGVKPISMKDDEVEELLVPLSSATMIHGFASGATERSNDTILRILASCSFSSFIANTNSSLFQRLTKRIGRNAKLISDSEIKKALSLKRLLEEV